VKITGLDVFVCGFDGYAWIYEHFQRFAQQNLPLEYSFFSEQTEGLGIIPIGKGDWRERMILCLDRLYSRDVIYLQEDFLIKNVDIDLLQEAYKLHVQSKALITKLGRNYEFNCVQIPGRVGPLEIYLQNPSDQYLMSHQPVAIYQRRFLIETLNTEKTPCASTHEINGSQIMRKRGETKVLCMGPTFRPNRSIIFEIEHAIRKGILLPDAEQLINTRI